MLSATSQFTQTAIVKSGAVAAAIGIATSALLWGGLSVQTAAATSLSVAPGLPPTTETGGIRFTSPVASTLGRRFDSEAIAAGFRALAADSATLGICRGDKCGW